MDAMQTQQQIAQDFEAGCAELSLLEAHMLESACDDPWSTSSASPYLAIPPEAAGSSSSTVLCQNRCKISKV